MQMVSLRVTPAALLVVPPAALFAANAIYAVSQGVSQVRVTPINNQDLLINDPPT
jgi:hypothetical protein